MDVKRRRATLALILISLGLAFWGQYLFARQRDRMWDGVLLYGMAVAMFIWGLSLSAAKRTRTVPRGLWLEVQTLWHSLAYRRVLCTIALALSFGVGFIALGRSRNKSFIDLLALWIFSILLALGAFVDWRLLWSRVRKVRLRFMPETAVVALLMIGTFLLRAINLGSIPWCSQAMKRLWAWNPWQC
jgi:hypothetical protein